MKRKTIHVSLAVQFLPSEFRRSLSLRTKIGLAVQADYTILIQQTMNQLSEFGITHGYALGNKIIQYLQQGALSVKLSEQCFNKSSVFAGDSEICRIHRDLNAVFCATRGKDPFTEDLDLPTGNDFGNELPPGIEILPVPYLKSPRDGSSGKCGFARDKKMHFLSVAVPPCVNLIKVQQRKTSAPDLDYFQTERFK